MWMSDGLDHGNARDFADGLAKIGTLGIFEDEAEKAPMAMRPAENANTGFGITLARVPADVQRDGRVAAFDSRGQILETAPYHFGLRSGEAKTTIALPLELRNDTTRIAVLGQESAGAVQLVDARFRRRPVGIASGGNADVEQPLLSDVFYIERALNPYAELHKGTIDQVLDSGVSVLVVADIGQMTLAEHDRVTKFVEEGGVLLRFGGAKLAAHSDDLVPVKLREGERLMGSSMTWASPQHLTPFGDESPFRGLNIANDVTISRQVLAEPSVELADHTWARLTDGTPLVTGTAKGRGWIVLFHIAASPGWSSLPISGLYVDMLRRVVELSEGMRGGAAAARTGTFPPYQTLDGFGRLEKAIPEATPLRASEIETAIPGPQHPPGLYGVQGALVALNTFGSRTTLQPLNVGRTIFLYAGTVARELKWPMLELALLILLVDALISLILRGYISMNTRGLRRKAARATPVLLLLVPLIALGFATPVFAAAARQAQPQGTQPLMDKGMASALDTRLAYVITGDAEVDGMRAAGPGRGRHGEGRPILLSPDLLADGERGKGSFACGGGQGRPVHARGRDHPVRHPRCTHLRVVRRDVPWRGDAAPAALQTRHSAPRAHTDRPCAHQDLLSVEGIPRPLERRSGLGGGASPDRSQQPASDPGSGARRRRGVPHHHGRQ